MVDIIMIGNVVVENCDFHHSSAYGLAVRKTPMVPLNPYDEDSWVLLEDTRPPFNRISHVTAHDNGIYGILIANSQAIGIEHCVVEYNNWRGYEAGTVAYDAGGTKLFRTRHIEVDDYIGRWNLGHGLWFDQDGRDITVRNSLFEHNNFRGLFLERRFGPALVENCVMQNNSEPVDKGIGRFRTSGFSLSACDTALIVDCRILEPRGWPVLVHSIDYIMQDGIIEPYGEEIYLQAWHNVYRNCTIDKGSDAGTFFTFGVNAAISQCYYFHFTRFENVTWRVAGVTIPVWWAMREGSTNCPPIRNDFDYDLRKWYDTPWNDE